MSQIRPDQDAVDLLIDIGGTNVRVTPLAKGAAGPIWRGSTRSFNTAQDIVAAYLDDVGAARVERVFFAVAGPVQDGRAALTNADLTINAAALKDAFGLSCAVVFNDLEALAYNLAGAETLDMTALTPASPSPGKTAIAVVPGTGLGLAAYVIKDGTTTVISTQGGHVRASPSTPLEIELCSVLLREKDYLCAEDILSGPGIARVYAGLHEVAGAALRTPGPDAKEIIARALNGDDPRATETVGVYCSMLGSYCGDMAMVFLSYGGVYLGGNIITALSPFLAQSNLANAFLNKGLMAPMMNDIAFGYFRMDEPVLEGLRAYALKG